MPLAISFELSDRELDEFQKAIKAATSAAGSMTAEQIMGAASKLLEDAGSLELPEFILSRLNMLDAQIAMLRDEAWALGEEDRQRVLSALVYFADPNDIIPDHVPVLGYLDDAIAIELTVRELRHELDAYGEFCDFRQTEAERRGLNPAVVGRAEWLALRRDELQDRMHRQRTREAGTGYGSSSGWAREGYTSSWRPGLMRVR